MTPLRRQHATRETRHHLLFEKPQWTSRDKPKQVRELGAYVIGIKRAPHDYLHTVVKPVPVPVNPVLDAMFEFGREYNGWQNDNDRLERILDNMTGFAKSVRSPEQADGMWQVATSIQAQLAIANYFRGAAPRYE